MGLTMRERHAIVREISERFQRSAKKERGRILDEFVELTGYNRCYAAFVLRNCGKKQARVLSGRRVVFVPGHARPPGAKRQRKRRYGDVILMNAVKQLWALSDGLCGKRLTVFIRETVPLLERQGVLCIAKDSTREQLLAISAATLDRMLARTKALTRLKGRSLTRPGTLLKHHIPIRTFAQWNDERPGFCEVDLVAHDGGSPFGEYIQTLDVTDVATGWTETQAVKNKAQCHVFEALKVIRARLPFPLLGIDSDNGGEFINNELERYCTDQQITFTRSRPYRKNDNCFVEQKNYSIVRRTVGYYRYETPGQLALLEQLYDSLRLYTNFFQPVMKLKEKLRTGSHLTRRYDTPQTPFRRLLGHPAVSEDLKQALSAHYERLSVLFLKQELNRLQAELFRTAIRAPTLSSGSSIPRPEHPWRQTGLQHKRQPQKLDPAGTGPPPMGTQKNLVDLERKNHNTLIHYSSKPVPQLRIEPYVRQRLTFE